MTGLDQLNASIGALNTNLAALATVAAQAVEAIKAGGGDVTSQASAVSSAADSVAKVAADLSAALNPPAPAP